MSSVSFPIDIIFVRASGRIGKIVANLQPGDKGIYSYPHTAFVVEVVGGFCRQHGIDVGDDVQYSAGRTSFRALVCPSCGTNRNVRPSGSVGSGDRAECIGCGREGPLSEFDRKIAQESAFYTCNACERTFESADRLCPACGSDDLTPLEEIPLARDTPYRFSRRLLDRLRHRPDLVASGPMSPIQDVPSAEPEEESGSDDSSSTWDSGKSAGPMEQEGQARSYDVLRTITEAAAARRKR